MCTIENANEGVKKDIKEKNVCRIWWDFWVTLLRLSSWLPKIMKMSQLIWDSFFIARKYFVRSSRHNIINLCMPNVVYWMAPGLILYVIKITAYKFRPNFSSISHYYCNLFCHSRHPVSRLSLFYFYSSTHDDPYSNHAH
jgi:hypothetical protein